MSCAITLLGIHKGAPALYDPQTGQCVIVFRPTAHGWSKAVKLAVQLSREIAYWSDQVEMRV